MVFSVLGIDFSKSDQSTLVDQYVVENFDSKSRYLPESFWRTKEPAVCYFSKKRWFNIIVVFSLNIFFLLNCKDKNI